MILFKDRYLNIAILISGAWHLIFIVSVKPVLLPDNIKRHAASISFIGSFLERVAAVHEKPFDVNHASLIQKIEIAGAVNSAVIGLKAPEIGLKILEIAEDKGEITISSDKNENIVFDTYAIKEDKPKIRFRDVLVSGAAKDRMVLYKPVLDTAPFFLSDFSSNYNVSVSFKISGYGFVYGPECIESSGSSEIDRIAVRYVRGWQFAPLQDGLDRIDEGVVRVNFGSS